MLATRRGSISIGEPTEPSLSVVSASAPHDAQSDDVKGNPIYDPAQTMLRRTREDGLNHGYSLAQSAGCQQALAETRAACDSLNCLNATWNALWSKSGQMAYLETGKAASELSLIHI